MNEKINVTEEEMDAILKEGNEDIVMDFHAEVKTHHAITVTIDEEYYRKHHWIYENEKKLKNPYYVAGFPHKYLEREKDALNDLKEYLKENEVLYLRNNKLQFRLIDDLVVVFYDKDETTNDFKEAYDFSVDYIKRYRKEMDPNLKSVLIPTISVTQGVYIITQRRGFILLHDILPNVDIKIDCITNLPIDCGWIITKPLFDDDGCERLEYYNYYFTDDMTDEETGEVFTLPNKNGAESNLVIPDLCFLKMMMILRANGKFEISYLDDNTNIIQYESKEDGHRHIAVLKPWNMPEDENAPIEDIELKEREEQEHE